MTISAYPLLFMIVLTLLAYLTVSVRDVLCDMEEVLIDAALYDAQWLLREYGIVGVLLIHILQGVFDVRYALQSQKI